MNAPFRPVAVAPDFAHSPMPPRWSMLAWSPGENPYPLEYNFSAPSLRLAKNIAAFEAEYAARSMVRLRAPDGAIVFDGSTKEIKGREAGWGPTPGETYATPGFGDELNRTADMDERAFVPSSAWGR